MQCPGGSLQSRDSAAPAAIQGLFSFPCASCLPFPYTTLFRSIHRHHQARPLIDEYCSQLGSLLERRYTERALVAAKEQAERAMRQAQEADRAKSQFLATMTHELRTPLNAIIGFSEIIQTAPKQSADTPLYAQYIRDSGTQLLQMLNGVLDLAKIEAGKLDIDEQVADLDE